jgi:hypothetical protein
MPDVPVKEVDGSQKAAILKISNRLCVRFKHDGVQQKIPKGSWLFVESSAAKFWPAKSYYIPSATKCTRR